MCVGGGGAGGGSRGRLLLINGPPADKRDLTANLKICRWCIFKKYYPFRVIPEKFNDLS